jgi:hypothetical protein
MTKAQPETLEYILHTYADAAVPVVDAMVTTTSALEEACRIEVDKVIASAVLSRIANGHAPAKAASLLIGCARSQAQQMATTIVRSSDGFASLRHAGMLNALARYADVLCTGLARTLKDVAEGNRL